MPSRAASSILRALVGVLPLALFGALSSGCAMWDGGYPTAEFRLAVKDEHGAPVPDAELVVRDGDGVVSYDYPIDDFGRSRVIRSDDHGVMTFHHYGTGIEFGGSCFAGIGCGSGPKHVLEIVVHGEVRSSIGLMSLYPANTTAAVDEWMKVPLVTAHVLFPLSRAWLAFADPGSGRSTELYQTYRHALDTHDDYALLAVYPKDVEMRPIERDVVLRVATN